jgi:hypothetical protein
LNTEKQTSKFSWSFFGGFFGGGDEEIKEVHEKKNKKNAPKRTR